MIEVKKLINRIRYKSKDFNAVQYSDYDLMQAINECLRYMNQSYAMKNSDFLEAQYRIKQDELEVSLCCDGVDLPDDFMSIVQVTDGRRRLHYAPSYAKPKCDEYKISGGKIYATRDITLHYHKKLDTVKNEDDIIDLPDILFEPITKISGMILANAENDVLLQTVDTTVKAVVAKRKFSNAKAVLPFKV